MAIQGCWKPKPGLRGRRACKRGLPIGGGEQNCVNGEGLRGGRSGGAWENVRP